MPPSQAAEPGTVERATLRRLDALRVEAPTDRPHWLDALLRGRGLFYVLFRLRGALIASVSGLVVHVTELLFLLDMIVFQRAAGLWRIKALGYLSQAAWFGVLEHYRQRLRDEPSERRQLSDGWWTLGVLLGVAYAAGACVWAAQRGTDDGLVLFFGLLSLLRTALALTLQTLHSGVYAFGRLQRSLWFAPALDALSVTALVVGQANQHLPLRMAVLAVSAALGSGYSLFVVLRAYRQRELALPRLSWRALRRLALPARPLLALALCGLVLRPGELLFLLGLAWRIPVFIDEVEVLMFLFFAASLMSSTTGLALSFYPDVIAALRLHAPLLTRRLRAAVTGGSALMAVLTMALVAGVMWRLRLDVQVLALAYVAPLLLALALFGVAATFAFAQARRLRLLLAGALLAGGLSLGVWLAWPVWSLAAVPLTALAVLLALPLRDAPLPRRGSWEWLAEQLARLTQPDRPLTITVARLSVLGQGRAAALARALAVPLYASPEPGEFVAVQPAGAQSGPQTGPQTGPQQGALTAAQLVAASGGALQRFTQHTLSAQAAAAWLLAQSQGRGVGRGEVSDTSPQPNPAAQLLQFATANAWYAALPAAERHELLAALRARSGRSAGWRVRYLSASADRSGAWVWRVTASAHPSILREPLQRGAASEPS